MPRPSTSRERERARTDLRGFIRDAMVGVEIIVPGERQVPLHALDFDSFVFDFVDELTSEGEGGETEEWYIVDRQPIDSAPVK